MVSSRSRRASGSTRTRSISRGEHHVAYVSLETIRENVLTQCLGFEPSNIPGTTELPSELDNRREASNGTRVILFVR